MSFQHIINLMKPNGSYKEEVDLNVYDEYAAWKDESIKDPNILDMNKHELQQYARDTYGMSTQGMKASNILKAMYEHVHGVEVSNRGRKKAT